MIFFKTIKTTFICNNNIITNDDKNGSKTFFKKYRIYFINNYYFFGKHQKIVDEIFFRYVIKVEVF